MTIKNLPNLGSLLLLTAAMACRPEIDTRSGDCYQVSQLLASGNAAVPCDRAADFEGSILCLSGVLEVSNDPRALPRNFYLLDARNSNRAVEVHMDSLVAAQVIAQVRTRRGRPAAVKGVISGHDQPGNPYCRRAFSVLLADAADLDVD